VAGGEPHRELHGERRAPAAGLHPAGRRDRHLPRLRRPPRPLHHVQRGPHLLRGRGPARPYGGRTLVLP
jgi:hypothetical protein